MGRGLSSGGVNSSASSLLKVLSDPSALKRSLDEFNDAKQAAADMVALAGPAGEILQLREQLGKTLDEEQTEAVRLKAECEALVFESQIEGKRLISNAESTAEEILTSAKNTHDQAEEVLAKANRVSSEVKAKVLEADRRATVLSAKEDSLNQRAAELDRREQELEGEKGKLAGLSEHIRQTLR